MQSAKVRLALVALVLLAWIGYLAYLALPSTTSREVLSHAQFLESTVDVIATVDAKDDTPNSQVQVQEVHWPPASKDLAGQKIIVDNLTSHCKGWHGPGDYILPLVRDGDGYAIAPVPRSPGFDGSRTPRIYAATPQNRRQLDTIPKPPP